MFNYGDSKASGIVIATGLDGKEIQQDTHQCCHCGRHWIVVKGSGRPHVFCKKCGDWTCSKSTCLIDCNPIKKLIDA